MNKKDKEIAEESFYRQENEKLKDMLLKLLLKETGLDQ